MTDNNEEIDQEDVRKLREEKEQEFNFKEKATQTCERMKDIESELTSRIRLIDEEAERDKFKKMLNFRKKCSEISVRSTKKL